MSLTLYFHPLSSFCHKVLIALYENETPFEAKLTNLQDEEESANLRKLWPIRKFPVLQDHKRNQIIPETSIIIEYLARHYPGTFQFLPADPDLALQTRFTDRLYDLYIHLPMQKAIGDRMRPAGSKDPHGVDEARKQITIAYGIIEKDMAARTWAMGDVFTLADCAAAPALFYANMVVPFGGFTNVAAYFERLRQRPSYARVLREAEPYLHMVPQ